ncbi:hypothetical protein HYO65_gp307 [Tenacibaculum phage PTm1]|uniref:Uncharacterized protein n=2 Tax=Shirahamavirus PTm1 TaxID=2846435 RepID=A0A5S9EQU5_9CAUD|nr:hypothetical protein HYO65_gp307 [Tenacibaculum phage PTm1]BBI90699.1 hypothetical protein [Tenacibaculum phage PTm1]BBI91005.1 hypothetical protein [Tenacibaculum phage PTm5]
MKKLYDHISENLVTEKKQSFVEWEDEVTNLVSKGLGVSRGDAQGIIEAESSLIDDAWGDGLSPKETANKILNK